MDSLYQQPMLLTDNPKSFKAFPSLVKLPFDTTTQKSRLVDLLSEMRNFRNLTMTGSQVSTMMPSQFEQRVTQDVFKKFVK